VQTDCIFKRRIWSGIQRKKQFKGAECKKAISMTKWLAINSNIGQPPLQGYGVQLGQELIVKDF